MADSETDTRQQVTSKTPATKQKDPKKVAAGKALQEKNRQAREEQRKIFEAQKKALDLANMKIAKFELKDVETPVDAPVDKKVLTTTQWLSVISIVVSFYYKREEIKGLLKKTRLSVRLPFPQTRLLILRQEEASNRWIKNQLDFYFDFQNNGCSSSFR